MRRELVTHSRFLSQILRHQPALVGVVLEEGGWIEVATLLAAVRQKRPEITLSCLLEIVEMNDKKRLELSPDHSRIRACQGHSHKVGVDLGLAPAIPPKQLYHGTAEAHLGPIQRQGLDRRKRSHVHLSTEPETARKVGARHGTPIILTIAAVRMNQAGHSFYRSTNGVWLTEKVPPEFISFPG